MENQQLYFTHRSEWRAWLQTNHNEVKPIWLLFHKKKSGKLTMEYEDAVQEALCFGWIDSIIKNIDAERYLRKFMPRTNFFKWSESNRKRVKLLIENGLMTNIGLEKIGKFKESGIIEWTKETPVHDSLSPSLIDILKTDKLAFHNFQNLSASHKKRYVRWIMDAKREETRIKRMHEAIILLHENTKTLLK